MPNIRRVIEWEIFWFREVLFISMAMLIVVFTLPTGDHIHSARLAVLLTVLIGLTLVNVLWVVLGASSHR